MPQQSLDWLAVGYNISNTTEFSMGSPPADPLKISVSVSMHVPTILVTILHCLGKPLAVSSLQHCLTIRPSFQLLVLFVWIVWHPVTTLSGNVQFLTCLHHPDVRLLYICWVHPSSS